MRAAQQKVVVWQAGSSSVPFAFLLFLLGCKLIDCYHSPKVGLPFSVNPLSHTQSDTKPVSELISVISHDPGSPKNPTYECRRLWGHMRL